MAFTRQTIRNLAKESGVEIPKEFEDALVAEHLNARNAYAEEQVKAELEKQPATKAENVKDSDEYKALKADFDKYKAEVSAKETKAAKEAAYIGTNVEYAAFVQLNWVQEEEKENICSNAPQLNTQTNTSD